MAAAIKTFLPEPQPSSSTTVSLAQLPQISKVFRGYELTRKDRRLGSGLSAIDAILGGGIVRGRVSEMVGRGSSGKTSLAASFLANVTNRGEIAAWIDASGAFDPRSMIAAGADLRRVLWVFAPRKPVSNDHLRKVGRFAGASRPSISIECHAAEMVLKTGGFGLIVIDFGDSRQILSPAMTLRLARAAEQSGAAVLVLATHRICGTFAALSLDLCRLRMLMGCTADDAPSLFDGFEAQVRIARNKLGRSCTAAAFSAMADPGARDSDSTTRHQSAIFLDRGEVHA